MLVIKLRSCARCAGFELDLQTKNSRSQFFFSDSYRPKVELKRDIAISLGGTWPSGDILPRNYRSLLCHFTLVAINFH